MRGLLLRSIHRPLNHFGSLPALTTGSKWLPYTKARDTAFLACWRYTPAIAWLFGLQAIRSSDYAWLLTRETSLYHLLLTFPIIALVHEWIPSILDHLRQLALPHSSPDWEATTIGVLNINAMQFYGATILPNRHHSDTIAVFFINFLDAHNSPDISISAHLCPIVDLYGNLEIFSNTIHISVYT